MPKYALCVVFPALNAFVCEPTAPNNEVTIDLVADMMNLVPDAAIIEVELNMSAPDWVRLDIYTKGKKKRVFHYRGDYFIEWAGGQPPA